MVSGDVSGGHGLSRRVGWRISRHPLRSGRQNPGLLDHPREVRGRLFVDGRRPSLPRLPDFRQVAAGQSAVPSGHLSRSPQRQANRAYRLGLEQYRPLPIAGVDKPAATLRSAGQPLP